MSQPAASVDPLEPEEPVGLGFRVEAVSVWKGAGRTVYGRWRLGVRCFGTICGTRQDALVCVCASVSLLPPPPTPPPSHSPRTLPKSDARVCKVDRWILRQQEMVGHYEVPQIPS